MIFWASNVGTENGTLTVYNGKDGLIVTRGCFTGTVDGFLAKSAEVHDEKTKREYQLLIEVAKSRILGTATE
ncbi:phage associated protein [Mannheimia sp. USDA-ARS-USMARC-1261]|nr:phage associated protein [Mannheimia sp. USDA-ARS-USMARC-1261]